MTTITTRELTKGLWSISIEEPHMDEFSYRKRLTAEGYSILSCTHERNNLIFIANFKGEKNRAYSTIELSNSQMAMVFNLEYALEHDARSLLENEGYKVVSATMCHETNHMIFITKVQSITPLVRMV